jgi:hypothetical protein
MVISVSGELVTPFARFKTEVEGKSFLRSLDNSLIALCPVINYKNGISKYVILIAHHITHTSYFSKEESLKSVLPLLLLILWRAVPQLVEAMP